MTEYTDDQGNALPRTSLILLERAVKDEFGTVNSWQIFEAIGQLKDRDSSVRERLFEYLNKGTESSNYSQILDALVNISGSGSQVLRSTDWADLTPSDYSELQPYLSHELDWDKVDLAKFEVFYQDVYDEALLAELMNNLIDRADYGNLGRLVRLASGTRGFDVQVNGEERIEPINAALGRLATIEKTPITQTIRKRAIDTLISRLNNIAHLRTEAQNGDFIASVLVEVLRPTRL